MDTKYYISCEGGEYDKQIQNEKRPNILVYM